MQEKTESFDEKIREVDSFYVVSSLPSTKKNFSMSPLENRTSVIVHEYTQPAFVYYWYKSKKVEPVVVWANINVNMEMASKKVDLFKYKFTVYWIEFALESERVSLAFLQNSTLAAWFFFYYSSRYVLIEFTEKLNANVSCL